MKHVVGFSGGIDSQACARWVLNRFPKEDVILLNSDAGGNEHPLTTEFIEWYSANVHPVVVVKATVADMDGRAQAAIQRRGLKPTDHLDFGLLAELKQCFPTHMQQFCTTHLKLMPSKRWMQENIPDGFTRYTGVRRDESNRRKNTACSTWDDYFDCDLVQPLFDWCKSMCFDYVKAHGERINELYSMGFDRVGCAPCVNSNKEDIRNWASRFPEMIDKVRRWEQQTGKSFFRPEKKGAPIRWIDDVVEWARTVDHGRSIVKGGGRQLSILADVVEPCSSKYGLCE